MFTIRDFSSSVGSCIRASEYDYRRSWDLASTPKILQMSSHALAINNVLCNISACVYVCACACVS